MPIVPYLRLFKLLAVSLLVAGTLGSTFRLPLAERRWFAYRLTGPAFGLTWILGIVWAAVTDVSLTAGWILGAMALSFTSLQAVLYLAGREERGGPISRSLAIIPLALCFVLMVFRP